MIGMIATLSFLSAFMAIGSAGSMIENRRRRLDFIPPQFVMALYGGFCLVSVVLACLVAIMRLAPR